MSKFDATTGAGATLSRPETDFFLAVGNAAAAAGLGLRREAIAVCVPSRGPGPFISDSTNGGPGVIDLCSPNHSIVSALLIS